MCFSLESIQSFISAFKSTWNKLFISQCLGILLSCFWRTFYLDFFQAMLGNWNNSNTAVTIFDVLIQSLLKSWLTEGFPFTTNGTWIWSEMTWKVKQLIFFLVLGSYLKFDFATENPVQSGSSIMAKNLKYYLNAYGKIFFQYCDTAVRSCCLTEKRNSLLSLESIKFPLLT